MDMRHNASASYCLAFGLMGVCLLGALHVMHSRIGQVLKTIQDKELKLPTLGYRTQFVMLVIDFRPGDGPSSRGSNRTA